LSRREAVTNHRVLNDAYAILDTAQQMAERRFGNSETRERVLSFVREALAETLERGENLMKPRSPSQPERRRDVLTRGTPVQLVNPIVLYDVIFWYDS
jgi:hypothetical protein